jgi:putative ABC transport system ATP-binding protein
MNQTYAVQAAHISKVYGKGPTAFEVLHDINLNIAQGESVAIVGKSGSGKSTLMHVLALLDKSTKGSLAIDGTNVSDMKGKQLDLLRNKTYGFVFQQFFLNGHETVLNNVILPLKIAGVSSKERKLRGLRVLQAVDLAPKAHSRASDLSGGQKQRVCIARALITNPQIVFADEPTGNLDSQTGKTVEDLLFALNRKRGITLIIVTHDPDIARRCSRQIHISDGQITIPASRIV